MQESTTLKSKKPSDNRKAEIEKNTTITAEVTTGRQSVTDETKEEPLAENCESDSDSDSDDETTLAALGQVGMVGNPRDKKDKHQKRMQPKNAGAPTTKANKEASKRGNRVRKETEKMTQFRNHGKNKDGKPSY